MTSTSWYIEITNRHRRVAVQTKTGNPERGRDGNQLTMTVMKMRMMSYGQMMKRQRRNLPGRYKQSWTHLNICPPHLTRTVKRNSQTRTVMKMQMRLMMKVRTGMRLY